MSPRNRPFQSAATAVEQPRRHRDVVNQAPQLGLAESPYLTLEEGARFCRFDDCQNPIDAFRKWLHRQAVPLRRRGRKLLVERRALEAAMAAEGSVR